MLVHEVNQAADCWGFGIVLSASRIAALQPFSDRVSQGMGLACSVIFAHREPSDPAPIAQMRACDIEIILCEMEDGKRVHSHHRDAAPDGSSASRSARARPLRAKPLPPLWGGPRCRVNATEVTLTT